MNTFDRSAVDPWYLSGKPVVRLWGRDFTQSVDTYCEWLLELSKIYSINANIKRLVDPPGVVVQTYLDKKPKPLVDPLLVVSADEMPWLFCSARECQNRIAEGMPPGSVCAQHLKG